MQDDTRRRATRGVAGLGVLALGALAAAEAAAVRRVRRVEDRGGRDHTAAVGEGVGEPLGLVLLGDSAVDGHGLDTHDALPWQLATRVAAATGRRVRVRSLAVNGATTSDVAAFQVPLLRASGQVDAVLVGVGVNDVLRRTPPAALEEATLQLLAGVRQAAPGAWLAVATCPDLSRAPGLGPVLRRVVGRRCRAVARRQQRLLSEQGIPAVATEDVPAPGLFGPDGLHPGTDGLAVLAALAATALVG
jgi:lysophospholipase L1-like esterase